MNPEEIETLKAEHESMLVALRRLTDAWRAGHFADLAFAMQMAAGVFKQVDPLCKTLAAMSSQSVSG